MKPGLKGTMIRGAAGTYAVCFELSRRGWIVVPTYGNSPGVDIFASKSGKTIGIQVKTTMRENDGWMVPPPGKIQQDLYYVFVAAADAGLPLTGYSEALKSPRFATTIRKSTSFIFGTSP